MKARGGLLLPTLTTAARCPGPREHGRQRDRRMTEKCDQNCGQGRALGGSIIVLWLLPELDLNQQPCD
jgi:hypothetical protein